MNWFSNPLSIMSISWDGMPNISTVIILSIFKNKAWLFLKYIACCSGSKLSAGNYIELGSKWTERRVACRILILSKKWSLANVAFDEERVLFRVRISVRHTLVSCTPTKSFTRALFPASSSITAQMGRITTVIKKAERNNNLQVNAFEFMMSMIVLQPWRDHGRARANIM